MHRAARRRPAAEGRLIGLGGLESQDEGGEGLCVRQGIDMRSTCEHVLYMSVMVQIRNVPDELHRRLKSRAALAGMSLSEYLLSELRQIAERLTPEEMRARLSEREKTILSVSVADLLRAERDNR
jgi:plasmid stability protein